MCEIDASLWLLPSLSCMTQAVCHRRRQGGRRGKRCEESCDLGGREEEEEGLEERAGDSK